MIVEKSTADTKKRSQSSHFVESSHLRHSLQSFRSMLTYWRYTQREFKLKFIEVKNNFSNQHYRNTRVLLGVIVVVIVVAAAGQTIGPISSN